MYGTSDLRQGALCDSAGCGPCICHLSRAVEYLDMAAPPFARNHMRQTIKIDTSVCAEPPPPCPPQLPRFGVFNAGQITSRTQATRPFLTRLNVQGLLYKSHPGRGLERRSWNWYVLEITDLYYRSTQIRPHLVRLRITVEPL